MGADLYINKLYEARDKKYRKAFEDAVEKRNTFDKLVLEKCPKWSPKYEALQKRSERLQKAVGKAYDAMYGGGVYFRDSYNRTNMLNLFGLSWWNDFSKFLDKENHLSVENCKRVLAECKLREATFRKNIQKMELIEDETREDVVKYFEMDYKEFKRFLNKAIKTNNFIRASI
jgi:hypothetical protein